MTVKTRLISLFWSTDLWIGLVIGGVFWTLAPDKIVPSIAAAILSVCVSVLAIVFSIFFAAVAIVMTAGDNDFVRFLEEDNTYMHIVWTFQATLFLLLLALVTSLFLYVGTLLAGDPWPSGIAAQVKLILAAFLFLSSWALFAAFNASHDAIKYAQFRARFVRLRADSTSTNSSSIRTEEKPEKQPKESDPSDIATTSTETPSSTTPAADPPRGPATLR